MHNPLIRKATLLVASFVVGAAIAVAQSSKQPYQAKEPGALKLPVGFTAPKSTLSPNGRYGVLVPNDNHWRENVPQNAIIDLKSGRIVGTIRGWTGLNPPERDHFDPSRWSSDSSLLLWEVEGKWTDHTLVLITIRNGKIVSQLDVLDIMCRTIEARTKRAIRSKRSAAVIFDAYTDVRADGNSGTRISLPLKIHAILQSNRKAMGTNLIPANSEMDAFVTTSGKIVVTHFNFYDD